jgi:uncharacterized protein
MSAADNKAVVRDYMQAVADGDIDRIRELQHPDIEWWILGHGTMDRDMFTDQVRVGLLTAKQRRIEITGLTAEDDRVAVQAESEMIFPDGRVYRNFYHNLLVIRDGRIVAGSEYMDTRAVEAAFTN